MENKKSSYRSTIKDFVSELDADARTKRQLYIALNGGIYSSLKDKRGEGTKTMYFDDGTKQEVGTYEGRFKAISKSLGDDYESSNKLYRLITENGYSSNSREAKLKERMIQGYKLPEKKDLEACVSEDSKESKDFSENYSESPIADIPKDESQGRFAKFKTYVKNTTKGIAAAALLFAGSFKGNDSYTPASSSNYGQNAPKVESVEQEKLNNLAQAKYHNNSSSKESIEASKKETLAIKEETPSKQNVAVEQEELLNSASQLYSEHTLGESEIENSKGLEGSLKEDSSRKEKVSSALPLQISPEKLEGNPLLKRVADNLNLSQKRPYSGKLPQSYLSRAIVNQDGTLTANLGSNNPTVLETPSPVETEKTTAPTPKSEYKPVQEKPVQRSKDGLEIRIGGLPSRREYKKHFPYGLGFGSTKNSNAYENRDVSANLENSSVATSPQEKPNQMPKSTSEHTDDHGYFVANYMPKTPQLETDFEPANREYVETPNSIPEPSKQPTRDAKMPVALVQSTSEESQATPEESNLAQKVQVVESKEKPSFFEGLRKYQEHVNQRNAQIVDGDISINAWDYARQMGQNFVPLMEGVTDFSRMGYSDEALSSRTDTVKGNSKKFINGLKRLVSLGFWDSRSNEEKEKEGNQIVSVLKSPYDVVSGAVGTAVNVVDYPLAGGLEYTLRGVGQATRGVVRSAVGTVNYTGALLSYPLDKAEELIHPNTISQNTYEVLSSVTTLAGNVLSREAAQNGKLVDVTLTDGSVVTLDKGNPGTIVELLLTGLLDTITVDKLLDGSGGSGNSGHNQVGPSNGGGINITPGTGGPVGGF